MKTKWILLLSLLFLTISEANQLDHRRKAFRVVSGGADIEENFEGTGTPAGWTVETGSPNFDQATTGLSLEASQCLYLQGEAQQQQAYASVTATDTLYSYCLIRFEDFPSGGARRQIAIKNDTTTLCELAILIDPATWNIYDSLLQDTGTFPNIDSTYHIWLEYQKGTGANGVIRLYVSSDGTKPASAECEITNSAETAQANRFYVGGWSADSGNYYVDKVRISRSTAFGSNPQ